MKSSATYLLTVLAAFALSAALPPKSSHEDHIAKRSDAVDPLGDGYQKYTNAEKPANQKRDKVVDPLGDGYQKYVNAEKRDEGPLGDTYHKYLEYADKVATQKRDKVVDPLGDGYKKYN